MPANLHTIMRCHTALSEWHCLTAQKLDCLTVTVILPAAIHCCSHPHLAIHFNHTGGDVNDVGWIGPSTAIQMLAEQKAVFLDCREEWEFAIEHIAGAHSVPMRAFVDYGLPKVYGPWVRRVLETKAADPLVPIVIYSNVATPFSRCR